MMRRWKKIIIAIAVLILVSIIISASLVNQYAQQDEKRTADAAIVLGAAAFGDVPSPVLRERINHAILLYEQGYVDHILFTGGHGKNSPLSEGEVSARYALNQGVPEEDILVEDQSTSTVENLMYAQELAKTHDLDTFLIVSSPSHMKRVMEIANDLGMEAYSSPTRTIEWIHWATKTRAFIREVILYEMYIVKKLLTE